MKENPFILVVDDDPNIARLVQLYLEKDGFEVATASRGDDALALFRERLERRLEHAATKMRLLSPYGVLERGYSLTRTEDGTVVRDAASLKRGTRLVTRLAKGEFASEVV